MKPAMRQLVELLARTAYEQIKTSRAASEMPSGNLPEKRPAA